MASLRDVLNHIGKPAELVRGGQAVAAFKATRRGALVLMEPKVEPVTGDVVRFTETGEAFRVVSVAAEKVMDRIDHYRVEAAPA